MEIQQNMENMNLDKYDDEDGIYLTSIMWLFRCSHFYLRVEDA